MSDYFDLPIDLFAEILVRLPIQDLVKSTAVCKSWNSLIKTPAFISTHLEKTISFNNSKNTHLLLFRLCTVPQPELRNFPSEVLLEHFSLRFDSKDVDEYKQLQFPCHRFGFGSRRDSFEIAGSINGLVCLVDILNSPGYGKDYILLNPIIKKLVRVPEHGVTYSSHGPHLSYSGFGFDSKRNDYKLLRFVELHDQDFKPRGPEPEVEVEIYSLNANCWRSITHIAPKYSLIRKMAKKYANCFVNGAIHMLVRDKDRNLILAFDVSEEVFREIPLPECLSNDPKKLEYTDLLKYGQSIAAQYGIHLWVMKEYGVALSWTDVFSEVANMVPGRVLFFRNEEEVFVTLRNEEELSLSSRDGWVVSFNIQSGQIESLNIQSVDYLTGYPVVDGYVESLVLLDNGNASWDLEDPEAEAMSELQSLLSEWEMIFSGRERSRNVHTNPILGRRRHKEILWHWKRVPNFIGKGAVSSKFVRQKRIRRKYWLRRREFLKCSRT